MLLRTLSKAPRFTSPTSARIFVAQTLHTCRHNSSGPLNPHPPNQPSFLWVQQHCLSNVAAHTDSGSTHNDVSEELFVHSWRIELERVEKFFVEKLTAVLVDLDVNATDADTTSDIFDLAAKKRKTNKQEVAKAVESLLALQTMRSLNTKGFREELMQWDKTHHSNLTQRLLPELMARSFSHSHTITHLLDILSPTSNLTDGYPVNANSSSNNNNKFKAQHRHHQPAWLRSLVAELVDLRTMLQRTNPLLLHKLVAHRGFHCPEDGTHRPMENTLQAMEQAWVHGLSLCECDITLTQDGQFILTHDDTLGRVSLFPESARSTAPVHELRFRDIVASPLKNGVRPPLLRDVLESARCLAPSPQQQQVAPAAEMWTFPQLVVEVKHGPTANVGTKLGRFLARNPRLVDHVAVVMSFNPEIVKQFSAAIAVVKNAHELSSMNVADDHDDHTHHPRVQRWPKSLLLTCAPATAVSPHEIELSISDSASVARALDLVKGAPTGSQRLDGLYLQYEPQMLSNPTAQSNLRSLCEAWCVGVWGVEPDCVGVAQQLADLGVAFVNTDLPPSFIEPAPAA